MRAARGAALGHPLATLFAAAGPGRLTLGRGDVAVAVGVHAREAGFGAGAGLGDHHRAVVGHPSGAGPGAMWAAMGVARAPISAGFGPMFAAGVELGLADDAVVVGVEAVEAGVGAGGAAVLTAGAHLFTGDGAVTVGVGGGEALDPGVDEFGAAEAPIAVSVGPQAPGLGGGVAWGMLGDGDAAGGGEGQGGQSARQNGLSHIDVSMAARRGRTSLSGE